MPYDIPNNADLSRIDVEKYLLKFKRRGEKTLSVLGKCKEFIDVKDTEFGKYFLGLLILDHETLLEKVAELTATEEEKIRYKITKELLLNYSNVINTYYDSISEIKKEIGKEK
jgi:hypothetical protein